MICTGTKNTYNSWYHHTCGNQSMSPWNHITAICSAWAALSNERSTYGLYHNSCSTNAANRQYVKCGCVPINLWHWNLHFNIGLRIVGYPTINVVRFGTCDYFCPHTNTSGLRRAAICNSHHLEELLFPNTLSLNKKYIQWDFGIHISTAYPNFPSLSHGEQLLWIRPLYSKCW